MWRGACGGRVPCPHPGPDERTISASMMNDENGSPPPPPLVPQHVPTSHVCQIKQKKNPLGFGPYLTCRVARSPYIEELYFIILLDHTFFRKIIILDVRAILYRNTQFIHFDYPSLAKVKYKNTSVGPLCAPNLIKFQYQTGKNTNASVFVIKFVLNKAF